MDRPLAAATVVTEARVSNPRLQLVGLWSNPYTCADVQVKNFIVESRFLNPFDKKLNPWSYGFFFRYRPGNEYRLTVNQAGRVGFGITEEKIVSVLSERFPEGVNTSPDGSNFIRLTVQGKDAVVFINDRYVATFDVAERQDSGKICLAAGFFPGDNIPEQETVYQDFTVYALPEYGIADTFIRLRRVWWHKSSEQFGRSENRDGLEDAQRE